MSTVSDIVIYGASDDLVEVEAIDQPIPGAPEEYDGDDITFVVHTNAGSCRLRARFARGGIWAIEVAPMQEDFPTPEVVITASGYTAKARIANVVSVVREHVVEEPE